MADTKSQACPPVGRGEVIVAAGDCMASIADARGFFWRTLWDLPDNVELKRARRDPNVLMPGDRVTVPPLRVREHEGAVDRRHCFRRRGVPEKLRIQFLDHAQRPRAGVPFRVDIAGQETAGVTDAQGHVELWVDPRATRGRIILDPDAPPSLREVHELDIGHLQPLQSPQGVVARLHALGYHAPGQRLEDALRAFQEAEGLGPSGEADPPTLARLRAHYGS